LSEGLKATINKQLQAMGGEMVMVMPGSDDDFFTAMMFGSANLQREDIEAIKKTQGVEKVLGLSYTGSVARYKEESKQVGIAGYDPWKEGLDILQVFQGWSLKSGRWPSKGNEILIGSQVASSIFAKEVKAGSEMTIKGRKFIVAGILNSLGNKQDDSMIYMDMDIYQDITGEKRGTAAYAMAKLTAGSDENVVADDIEEALRETRKRRSGTDEDDFSVITSEKMGQIAGDILGIIQMVVIAFASIAILVGGIGITNSMFTSVRERTKEIGIMKAIGAKNSAILLIFLFEAGIIGLIGGIGGTLLGALLAKGIEMYGQVNPAFYFTATLSLGLVSFGLIFSFVIGCLAGVLPARAAAQAKPVDALRRHE
jgi:putative ABC transport system permease protein